MFKLKVETAFKRLLVSQKDTKPTLRACHVQRMQPESASAPFRKPHLMQMSHVSTCSAEQSERDNVRCKPRPTNKHNEYSEMPKEVRESRHSRDRPDSQRRNFEADKYHRELPKRNNHHGRRQNPREEVPERPNSRQKDLLMRARTNDIQQKIRQKEREQERLQQ
jgi:hypothetical protein